MDLYYFDASVLVKAYFWEVGTDDVRQVLREVRAAPPRMQVATSSIAFAEAASAVARRRFARQLTEDEADEIWNRLLMDFAGPELPYHLVEPRLDVVGRAAELARRHRLRALDAIHLATGIAARRRAPSGASFHFASSDRRLTAAAVSEAFDVFDPRSPVPPGTGSPVAPAE